MRTAVVEMCQYSIEPRTETWFRHELTQMRPALLGCDLFTNVPIVILLQENSAMLLSIFSTYEMLRFETF